MYAMATASAFGRVRDLTPFAPATTIAALPIRSTMVFGVAQATEHLAFGQCYDSTISNYILMAKYSQ